MRSVTEVCTNAVRGALVATPGRKLVISDLSNIEGRVAAWLAGEDWKLKAFREYDAGTGPDLYKLAYARSFRKEPQDVTKEERQVGKVMELSLAYQGSVGAFLTMGANYGVQLPEDEVLAIVRAWREAHPRIKHMWYNLEAAAKQAIGDEGAAYTVGPLVLDCKRDAYDVLWLRMRLPSGRYICYARPAVDKHECPTCSGKGTVWWEDQPYKCFDCGGSGQMGSGSLSYEGINQYTRKWERLDTYGGKIFEQATQGTARDVFMGGFKRAAAAGYDIVLRVHDELVADVPDEDRFNSDHLSELMATNEGWSVGLPLAAAGHEAYRYGKD